MSASITSGKERGKPVDSERYDKRFFLDSDNGCGCGGRKIIQDTGGRQFPVYYNEFYKLARIKPGDHVLDIGCGRGEFVVFCALQGAVATGIDYSADAIEIANSLKELAVKGQSDNSMTQRCYFRKVDAKSLPFADNEFDVIVSRAVVEHLHQWELLQMLEDCKRVLKPNGKLVIATHPNVWYRDFGFPIVYFFKRLLPFLRKASGEEKIFYNPHSERELGLHVNEQSVISLAKTLKTAGYRSHVWLGGRYAYRWDRLSKELGVKGIFLGLIINVLETWVPFKYIFADEIYAIARKV